MANYDADEDEHTGYDGTSGHPEDEMIKEKLDQMNPQRFQRDNFLDAISQIESSGGTNTSHPVIQHGPQAGQQAIGSYGLLPNTIQELSNRARLHNQLTPEMAAASRDPASVGQDPNLEKQYATQMADRVLNRFHDPAMAAYAWNSGHNLTPEQVKQRDYQNDPYVQKFQKIWKALGNK
jgi:hypothetical protein